MTDGHRNPLHNSGGVLRKCHRTGARAVVGLDVDERDRAAIDLPLGAVQCRADLVGTFDIFAVADKRLRHGDFLVRYPDVTVDIAMNDRFVDLVEEGFDVAVRIATLPNSSLIARRLAPARQVICASPQYLRARGAPQIPDDLRAHDCLFNSNLSSARDWRFTASDGSALPVTVAGRLSANSGDALRVH